MFNNECGVYFREVRPELLAGHRRRLHMRGVAAPAVRPVHVLAPEPRTCESDVWVRQLLGRREVGELRRGVVGSVRAGLLAAQPPALAQRGGHGWESSLRACHCQTSSPDVRTQARRTERHGEQTSCVTATIDMKTSIWRTCGSTKRCRMRRYSLQTKRKQHR